MRASEQECKRVVDLSLLLHKILSPDNRVCGVIPEYLGTDIRYKGRYLAWMNSRINMDYDSRFSKESILEITELLEEALNDLNRKD